MAFRNILRTSNKLSTPTSSPAASISTTTPALFGFGGGGSGEGHNRRRGEIDYDYQRKRRLCHVTVSTTTSPFVIQKAYFHHQNIIHFYIQTAHGILLEALQKSRVSEEKLIESLNVPDELKRLKAGSLKWLFAVWPTPRKSFSDMSRLIRTNEEGLIIGLEPAEETVGGSGSGGKPKSPRRLLRRPGAPSNSEELHAIVEYLKSKNIAIRRLIKLPWLLSADPVILDKSVERVQKMLNLEEFGVAISFVNLSDSKLVEATGTWKRDAVALSKRSMGGDPDPVRLRNRIDLLAYKLTCPKEDASDMLAKVNQLLTMPLDKIETTVKYLLEGGVTPEGIVNDPWVFIHNISKMRSRMQILQEKGITDFKPWVLRTPQRRFERYIDSELEELHLLAKANHKGSKGFLQQKLKCDEATASVMLTRVPRLKSASATKLNEMIEFLFSAGFTAKEIRETPRILAHSVETVSARLSEVLTFSRKPIINLHLLCRTSKDYRAALRKLKTVSAKKSDELPKETEPVEMR